MLRRQLAAFATLAAAAASATVLAAPAAAPAAGVPDRAPIVGQARGGEHGVVILIHGGAWVHHGPRFSLREHRRHAARLNALGYDTMSITYRPGLSSIADVVAFYDGVRRRRGPREPICALGDSAGGHLALMLAARRPGLDCAISRGAPTDLRGAHGIWKPAVDRRFAPFVPLARVSPVSYARRLAGRALASQALRDPLVDHSQLLRLRRASRGRIPTVTLPAGRAPYVHTGVDAGALRRLQRAEARLLATAVRRRSVERRLSLRRHIRARLAASR